MQVMCDIFGGDCYIRRSSIGSRYIRDIANDPIFISTKLNVTSSINTSICFADVQSDKASMSGEKISDDISRLHESESLNTTTFRKLDCVMKFTHPTFTSVLRYVLSYYPRSCVSKWVTKKGVYYISHSMVFDDKKKVMMSIEHGYDRTETLVVSKKCMESDDFMSKFIRDIIIKAFVTTRKGNVVIRDTDEYTDNHSYKYLDSKSLNEILNSRLRFLSKVSDFS